MGIQAGAVMVVCAAALVALVTPAAADVCRWKDANGVIHFAQRCDPNIRAERRWHGGTPGYRGGAQTSPSGPALTERDVVRAPVNAGTAPVGGPRTP